MKVKNLLMVAVLLAASTSVMLADLQVSSIPVTTIRADGQQELVGSVRFTVLAPASGNTGNITIDYGVPVSANSVIGVSTTGTFNTAAVAPPVGSIVTVTVVAGGNLGASITVSGVRIDATSGVTALDVQVSSQQLPIVAGQTVARVVNNSAISKTVTSISSAVILTDATIITGTGNITITEGFPSAWGNVNEEGAGAANSYQVRLQVNGLPTGVTLALALDASTSVSLGANLSVGTFTSAANATVITLTGNTLPAVTETIVVNYTFVAAGPTLPLAAATFNITATAFPNTGGGVPSFANDEMGNSAALTIIGGTTTLLFEFASVNGAAGVDTGLAIANTSADALAFSVGNAVPVGGPITFHFYPNDGTAPFSVTTAAGTPGDGLDANGQVAAGSTYVVLLSQLVGAGVDFSGYVFAVCGFTHGHGIVFAGDFVNFVQTVQGHVIPDPSTAPLALATNSRALLVAVGGETLGQ